MRTNYRFWCQKCKSGTMVECKSQEDLKEARKKFNAEHKDCEVMKK